MYCKFLYSWIYKILFTVFVVCVCQVQHVDSQIHPDVVKLYKNITQDYQKQIIPVWDQSKALDLYFMFVPLVINSFFETEETLSITVAINFVWTDPNLTWDPVKYGNKTHLTITSEDIWVPYVHLENSVDALEPLGYDSQFYAIIYFNGSVIYTPGGILKAKCPTDILRFPFDTETCRFIFTMWGAAKEHVTYIPQTPQAMMTYFTVNSNWDVVHQQQFEREKPNLKEFIFEISIKREPLYNLIVVILPTLLFAFMNPLVFLLPVESGERVSLSMTILLSYAIFLVLVASALPASSNPMCLLLLIMIVVMLLSGIIVVGVIITVYYYYIDEIAFTNSCLRFLATCCESKKSRYLKDDTSNTELKLSGIDIAKALDIIFIIVSYLFLIATLLVYFIFVLTV